MDNCAGDLYWDYYFGKCILFTYIGNYDTGQYHNDLESALDAIFALISPTVYFHFFLRLGDGIRNFN